MKEKDKKDVVDFLKSLALIVWGMAFLATAVKAFNAGQDFYIVTSIISVIGAAVFIIKK